MASPLFPLFALLPVELQFAIWAFALPDPEPELCIVWPLSIRGRAFIPGYEPEEPAGPFVVDTAWPAIAHVCRVAREAAFASPALRLRYSPLAGMPVPCRRFIPALDTLYWGRFQAAAVHDFLSRPENASFVGELRSIAVELAVTYWLGAIALPRAVNLERLSVVLPGSRKGHELNASVPFLPPARRCKLRDLPDGTPDEINYYNDLEPDGARVSSISSYLDGYRQGLGLCARGGSLGSIPSAGGAAGEADRSWVDRLEIKPQMFVEYAVAEHTREGQWVDVCMDRLLTGGPTRSQPPWIPVANRKNPEEYRGLDDDNKMHAV